MVNNQNFFLTTWIGLIVQYNIKSENDLKELENNDANKQTK